jgi:hypothetical protein
MEYKVPGTFKGGTILGVAIDVSPEVFLDLQKKQSARWSAIERASGIRSGHSQI